MTTGTKRRLMLLEDNPEVRYRQELARLRRQETVPLEEIVHALVGMPEAESNLFIGQITSGQALAILRLYDNTEEQTAELDRLERDLLPLEEQARQKVAKETR